MNDNIHITTSESFLHNLNSVISSPNIEVRGSITKELVAQNIFISDPLYRCYFVKGRNDNIFSKIAETLWMLQGRDDVKWLSYYLPRAEQFSDDGVTWRGAYGPRLRRYKGFRYNVDQLSNVIKILQEDSNSRRAIISIFDPSEDMCKTKDVPCNNWLHFLMRQGKLNLHISQRSCDILWGYSGIDTFSWSVLLQMMAYWLDLEVGYTHHFISSLHLYERHFNRATNLLDNNKDFSDIYVKYPNIYTPYFSTHFDDLDAKLWFLFDIENNSREVPDQSEFELIKRLEDEFLEECCRMLFIYIYYNRFLEVGNSYTYNFENLGFLIHNLIPDSDFRIACIEYITRKNNSIFKYVDLTDTEKDIFCNYYKRL